MPAREYARPTLQGRRLKTKTENTGNIEQPTFNNQHSTSNIELDKTDARAVRPYLSRLCAFALKNSVASVSSCKMSSAIFAFFCG
jgi:hypothetical protein